MYSYFPLLSLILGLQKGLRKVQITSPALVNDVLSSTLSLSLLSFSLLRGQCIHTNKNEKKRRQKISFYFPFPFVLLFVNREPRVIVIGIGVIDFRFSHSLNNCCQPPFLFFRICFEITIRPRLVCLAATLQMCQRQTLADERALRRYRDNGRSVQVTVVEDNFSGRRVG